MLYVGTLGITKLSTIIFCMVYSFIDLELNSSTTLKTRLTISKSIQNQISHIMQLRTASMCICALTSRQSCISYSSCYQLSFISSLSISNHEDWHILDVGYAGWVPHYVTRARCKCGLDCADVLLRVQEDERFPVNSPLQNWPTDSASVLAIRSFDAADSASARVRIWSATSSVPGFGAADWASVLPVTVFRLKENKMQWPACWTVRFCRLAAIFQIHGILQIVPDVYRYAWSLIYSVC